MLQEKHESQDMWSVFPQASAHDPHGFGGVFLDYTYGDAHALSELDMRKVLKLT